MLESGWESLEMGGIGGKDELRNESKECWGGGTRLEDKFTKASDVNLCDVENFLMCLLKEMSYFRMVGYELKWYCHECGTDLLRFSIGATGGKK